MTDSRQDKNPTKHDIIERYVLEPAKDPTDVVCPNFWMCKIVYGCSANCAWCFLQAHKNKWVGQNKPWPYLKGVDRFEKSFRLFQNKGYEPALLNFGESGEPMDHINLPEILEKFIDMNKSTLTGEPHRALVLTKKANIKPILELARRRPELPKYLVMAWSLNGLGVAHRWEKDAPMITQRLNAAAAAAEAGFEVRVRIDPMVPVKNCLDQYSKMIELMLDKFTPSMVTMGSLRGLAGVIRNCEDTSWVQFLSEISSFGKKIDLDTRRRMYIYVYELLKDSGVEHIALCKETLEMHTSLRSIGIDLLKAKCNCLP